MPPHSNTRPRRDYDSASPRSERYAPPNGRIDRWQPSYGRTGSKVTVKAEDMRDDANDLGYYEEDRMHNGRLLPKYFKRPLTCFYWANQGRCNKSDEECWYAHYWTGAVASAPVKVGSGASYAGRNAESKMDDQSLREKDLCMREQIAASRESNAAFNERAVERSAANLKKAIKSAYMALDSMNRAASTSRSTLASCLGELAIVNMEGGASKEIGRMASESIRGTLEAISELESRIQDIEWHMAANVGTYTLE